MACFLRYQLQHEYEVKRDSATVERFKSSAKSVSEKLAKLGSCGGFI